MAAEHDGFVKTTYEDNFRIIGIDIGWSNLAIVIVDVDKSSYVHNGCPNLFDFYVVGSIMVDLRDIPCNTPNCMFETKDRKGAHLVHHLMDKHAKWFESSDKVVIESQPIVSTHKDIEQLILYMVKLRWSGGDPTHVTLMAPQSLHSYFNMSDEKVIRRRQIIRIAGPYLDDMYHFERADAKDHLADAMGFVLLYINTVMKPPTTNKFKKFELTNS